MLGFHAEYAGGELRVQEEEIAEAGFFRYDALPPIPIADILPGDVVITRGTQDYATAKA
jgi:NADH pyrophosphatase NudC (nudix superfamily)